MGLKFLYSFLVLCFTTSILNAQVSFVAKVNKQRVGLNERLQVTFTVNKDGDNFRAPSFNGFKAQGPSQSVSTKWINGKSSFEKSFTYYLTPQQKGKYTITQATIIVKGQRYTTNPIDIQVVGSVANPTDGENPEYTAEKKIHLVARLSNTNPYLNEGVTLEYILYWENGVQISNPQLNDTPKFRDFWSQEIDLGQLEAKNGNYQGRPSAYVVYKKYVLYPQKSGKLKLSPISMTVPVQVPTNRRDFFGRPVYSTVNKTITAGNTILNVKKLPANAPENFTGAVGSFNFRVSQTKKSLNATESLQVKVKVSGTGNLKLFKLPVLKAPDAIEVYDPEHQENVRIRSNGMTGSIADNYTLVPQFKGNFSLPILKFSYFDPIEGAYKNIGAQNIVLDILQGPTQSQQKTTAALTTNTAETPVEEKVAAQQNKPFQFIAKDADLKPIKSILFFKSTLFWCLLLLPLLIIPVVILITKKSASLANDVEGSRARKASKLAKKYLSTAKKNLGDSTQFYLSLEKAFHNYLKSRLKIETEEMNKDNIHSILTDRKVPNETIEKFKAILETCEMARYTPSTLQTMKEDYNKASEVISLIDKQL